jgi:hypothetical protein
VNHQADGEHERASARTLDERRELITVLPVEQGAERCGGAPIAIASGALVL